MEMAPINEFVTGYIIIDGNQVATPGKAQIMSMTTNISIQYGTDPLNISARVTVLSSTAPLTV